MSKPSNRVRGGTLDVLMPMEKCPICGKEFLVQPNWGCIIVKQHRFAGNKTGTKVCSIKCMREFEDSQMEGAVRNAEKMLCVQVYKLKMIDGLPTSEIKKRFGFKQTAAVMNYVEKAEIFYWQEIQWLKRHKWRAKCG